MGINPVPERREMAARCGVEAWEDDDALEHIRDVTEGRGADAVIDDVGLEAHGSPGVHLAHQAIGVLPDAVARPLMERAGMDRLAALHASNDLVQLGRAACRERVGRYG